MPSHDSLPAEDMADDDLVCASCFHCRDEHDQDVDGWLCCATDCDCRNFVILEDDEWDGDEDRE